MPQQDLFVNIFGLPEAGMLEKVTTDYPYFSIAQFYLLKETDKNHPAYERIAGRTALHFNNPFYLQFLLNKKDVADVIEYRPETEVAAAIPESQPGTSDTKVLAQAPLPQPEILKEQPAPTSPSTELIFEPLYTTDYFASQGIKLSDEIKADDKLGKQLRSFTDWLKTMKKVHDQRLPAGSEQLDLAVQNIAEKSNTEAEIITESMAEVYIGQGKLVKAAEIYQKLSLLNPSKSAYFAAKIDSLKK